MTLTIDTTKLTETVGAEVLGVDVDRLLGDEELPGWTLDALEANGVLVFRDLHIDDATQVAFSRRLGHVEVLGTGEHPEIFLVTLDPAKNKAAPYLRGTFDWHIDGLTDDIPIKATLLSAHGVAESGGETEFASTYAAYDAADRRGEGALRVGPGGAHARGHATAPEPRPLARGAGHVAVAPGQGAAADLAAPQRSTVGGARADRRSRRRHGPGRGPRPAR